MTAIRILLHYTPVGVLEALGKGEGGRRARRVHLWCATDTLVCVHLSSSLSSYGHGNDLGLAGEELAWKELRNFQGDLNTPCGEMNVPPSPPQRRM